MKPIKVDEFAINKLTTFKPTDGGSYETLVVREEPFWVGHQQTITRGDVSITLIPTQERGWHHFIISRCPEPDTPFIRIQRESEVKEKVLLYRFNKPVPIFPSADCIEEMFPPESNTTRIIVPSLSGLVMPEGTLLLAGASNASMPVVLVFPPGQNIEGDGMQIFVVDKAKVDAAYDDTNTDYIRIVGLDVLDENPALFEQILEQHLLEVIDRMASQ